MILTFLSLSFSFILTPLLFLTFKGYKEFHPYIEARDRERNGQGSNEQTKAALATCVDTLKARTRRYAKVMSLFVMN